MAEKVVRAFSGEGYDTAFLTRYKEVAAGVFAPVVTSDPLLAVGAKNVTLTLAAGVGQVPIPDACTMILARPVSSTEMRMGLEAPEAAGAATGTAVAGDLKKGVPLRVDDPFPWFIDYGTGRTLYFAGGAADVVVVIFL